MWKDIPGYEGLYQVDETGNVKSLRSNTINRCKKQRQMVLIPEKFQCVVLGNATYIMGINGGKTND